MSFRFHSAAQNATTNGTDTASPNPKDVADVKLMHRVVIAFVAASFIMLLVVYRANAKEAAAKSQLEAEWRESRAHIRKIADKSETVTGLMVCGRSKLDLDEHQEIFDFLHDLRLGDSRCYSILKRYFPEGLQSDLAQMEPQARSVHASQSLRQILREYRTPETSEVSLQTSPETSETSIQTATQFVTQKETTV